MLETCFQRVTWGLSGCIFSDLYNEQARFACLRCAACGHFVSADLPSGRLRILEKQYVAFLFYTKYAELSFAYGYIDEIRTVAEIVS